MPDPVSDLLALEGFRTGLLLGLVAALGVALVAVVSRQSLPWGGGAVALASVAALEDLYRVDTLAIAGLVLIIAGGHLTAGRGPLLRIAGAAPGTGVFVAALDLDQPAWAIPMVAGVTLVGGALAASFDQVLGARGLALVLLAVTALGIYLTTPDTEHSSVLLGVVVPVMLLACPWPLATMGVGGAFASVALISWVVALDGAGRDGAVVGAVACLGVLVLEPIVRVATRGLASNAAPVPLRYSAAVVAVHVVLVVVCSRVGGLRSSAVEAFVVCAIGYAVAAVALVQASRLSRSPGSAEAGRLSAGDRRIA